MIDTGHVQLPVPAGWSAHTVEDGTILAGTARAGSFRPNLGVATEPFSGSVAAAATQAVAGALTLLKRVYVINYSMWPFDESDGGTETPGRWLEYTHEMEGLTLHVQHWILVRQGFLTRFTATCLPTQLPANDALFEGIIRAVRPSTLFTLEEGNQL